MIKVWQELRRFLKRSYRNQRAMRRFELHRRLACKDREVNSYGGKNVQP